MFRTTDASKRVNNPGWKNVYGEGKKDVKVALLVVVLGPENRDQWLGQDSRTTVVRIAGIVSRD